MATKMTAAEKNLTAKKSAFETLTLPDGAEQVGDFIWAIPVTVDGSERWVELALTAKNDKATKVAPAYDPFEKAEEWKAEKAAKAAEKAAKEKAKADKLAKSKSKSK